MTIGTVGAMVKLETDYVDTEGEKRILQDRL